jgi:putative ABC transport system permease protein
MVGFGYWSRPDGGAELCIVVGANLAEDSLGAVPHLTPHLRSQLTEPGAIVVDESELGRLGIRGIGDVILVGRLKARVVGLVRGLPSLQGPYVFCSVDTARHLLHMKSDQTIYVLGKCYDPADAELVAARLQRYPEMSVLTSKAFSLRSQMHWLTKTHAGVALGFAAVLGLVVGAVVTRQALYSATIASIREYAVLRAMGIPRWRMALNLAQLAFWVGLVGAALAVPGIYGVRQAMTTVNVPLLLPWWLVLSSVFVTWLVAILAGLSALSTLRQVEPMILLR